MKKLAAWSCWLDGSTWSVLLAVGVAQAVPAADVVIATAEEAQAFTQEAPFVFSGQTLSVHSSFATDRSIQLERLAPVIVGPDTHFELRGNVVSAGPPLGAALEKRGLGTLTLAGQNRYTSNTVLREGRLRLSGDSALGDSLYSLQQQGGTVLELDDGARVMNFIQVTAARPGDQALPGLEGLVNWQVDAGEATLVHHVNATLPVHKTGEGSLRLAGILQGNPEFRVLSGALVVDSAADARVSVASGARLEGHGRLGRLHVLEGGMVAPGGRAAAATLTVWGDAVFDPGSLYHVNAFPDGQADLLSVGGQVWLNGRVQAQAGDGDWATASRYRIVQAEGGLGDTRFAGVETDLAFLQPELEYDGQSVYLTLSRNDLDPGDFAETPEEREVGEALVPVQPPPVVDETPVVPDPSPVAEVSPQPDPPDVAVTPSPEEPPAVAVDQRPATALEQAIQGASVAQVRSLLQQSSGSWHASVRSFLVEEGRHVRQAVLSQSDDARGQTESGPRAWAQLHASGGQRHRRQGVDGDRHQSSGVVLGLDAPINADWRWGPVLAVQQTQLKRSAGQTQASADHYHAGWAAYGDWQGMKVTTALLRSWHRVDSRRSVVAGPLRELARSDYAGRSWHLMLELAPHMRSLKAWGETLRQAVDARSADTTGGQAADLRMGPYLRHEWVHLKLPGHTETGSLLSHSVHASRTRMNATTLGWRWQQNGNHHGAPTWLEADVGWRLAWGGTRVSSRQHFVETGPARQFESTGQPLARSALALALEAGFAPARNMELALRYSGLYGSGYQGHTAWADARWAF